MTGTGGPSGSGNTYQWQIASGPYSSSGGGAIDRHVDAIEPRRDVVFLPGTGQLGLGLGWARSPARKPPAPAAGPSPTTTPAATTASPIPQRRLLVGRVARAAVRPFLSAAGPFGTAAPAPRAKAAAILVLQLHGNYTLAADGTWNPASGSGWSSGNGFTSSAYSGSGTYSYNIGGSSANGIRCRAASRNRAATAAASPITPPPPSAPAAGRRAAGSGPVLQRQLSKRLGQRLVQHPGNAQGFAFRARPPRAAANRPTASSRPRLRWIPAAIGSNPAARAATTATPGSLPASGAAIRTSSTASRLAGSFSQSASQDDTSNYTTGGSVGASGQWVPSGSGSETLVTSSGNSYSGSGNATGTPSSLGSCLNGWISSGTQSESESATANAEPHHLLLPGLRRLLAGHQRQRDDHRQPNDLRRILRLRQLTRPIPATAQRRVDSGQLLAGPEQHHLLQLQHQRFLADPLRLRGRGVLAGQQRQRRDRRFRRQQLLLLGQRLLRRRASGPSGTMSQSGGASESFSYTKDYTIDGSGNWQSRDSGGEGTGGGASGSGSTFSSYSGGPRSPT